MTSDKRIGLVKRESHQGSNDSSMNVEGVNCGTYHHTTPQESDEIRLRANMSFSKLLQGLYPADASLRILDAGCGLGFLMSVAAKRFSKADITGVDLFSHGSMSGMSVDEAAKNTRHHFRRVRQSEISQVVHRTQKASLQQSTASQCGASTFVPHLSSSGDEGKYIRYRDASVLMRWMILGSALDSRALGTSVAIPMLEKYCSNPGGL
jgi:hypothetical protein